jgi:hypothetical protein
MLHTRLEVGLEQLSILSFCYPCVPSRKRSSTLFTRAFRNCQDVCLVLEDHHDGDLFRRSTSLKQASFLDGSSGRLQACPNENRDTASLSS